MMTRAAATALTTTPNITNAGVLTAFKLHYEILIVHGHSAHAALRQ